MAKAGKPKAPVRIPQEPNWSDVPDLSGDWDHIFTAWKRNLARFNVKVVPFFNPIVLHDPDHLHDSDGTVHLWWWPKDKVQAHHLAVQKSCYGIRSGLMPDAMLQGQVTTLGKIWHVEGDSENIAAVLMAASLFCRGEGSRTHFPDQWTIPKQSFQNFRRCIYKKLTDQDDGEMWTPLNTDTLPCRSVDFDYHIDNIDTLIRYLAEEHAALLCSYTAIVAQYEEQPDPFIQRAIELHLEECEKSDAAYKAEEAKWKAQREQIKQDEAELFRVKKRKHPRYGEWGTLSKGELEQLVWNMPTVQLAQEFDISDVMIGKECKRMGIIKPTVGFWNKVAAGKLPHPNGKPIESND
jgi:hypothetical protein